MKSGQKHEWGQMKTKLEEVVLSSSLDGFTLDRDVVTKFGVA